MITATPNPHSPLGNLLLVFRHADGRTTILAELIGTSLNLNLTAAAAA